MSGRSRRDEVLRQRRDIEHPLPQRRHLQGNDAEAQIQIAPKRAVLDQTIQIQGRGRDDPQPGSGRRPVAGGVLLDDEVQQSRLIRRIQLTDLVQKECSWSVLRKRRHAPIERVGRRSRAGEHAESAITTGAARMDLARKGLFSGAGLTQQQDTHVSRGNHRQGVAESGKGGGAAN